MTQKFFVELAGKLGRSDLVTDQRFCNFSARPEHREALTQVPDQQFKKRRTSEWLDTPSSVVPVSPVLDLSEALNGPFVQEIDMLRSLPHPHRTDFRALAN